MGINSGPVPRQDNAGHVGTAAKRWGEGYFTALHSTQLDATQINATQLNCDNVSAVTTHNADMNAHREAFPKLDMDTVFYVRTNGNDGNDGLTEATACATLAGVLDKIAVYNCNDFGVTVNLGEGNFVSSQITTGRFVRCQYLSIIGQNEATVLIGSIGINAFGGNVEIRVSNIAIKVTSTAVYARNNAYVTISGNIYIQGGIVGVSAMEGGRVSVIGANMFIDSITAYSFYAQFISSIQATNTTITHRLAMSVNSYILTERMGFVLFSSTVTFVNPANVSGTKFRVHKGSLIETSGQGINFFPGTGAGIADTTTGGYYL